MTAWLVAGLTAGCVKHYRPPTVDEPHAVVKVRRAYHTNAGTRLSEHAFIGDFQVISEHRPSRLDETRTTAVRVRPGPVSWTVGSGYSHTVRRMVRERYTVRTPYTARESYSCGSSSSGSRTCTRSVTRYRSENRWRTVTRDVQVSDGRCAMQLSHIAEVGRSYLLQYSYSGPDICSLQCIEQLPRADGKFDTRPCKTPSPAMPHQ